jgi:homoserine O-succinyltransferase/O-acetyltransferase
MSVVIDQMASLPRRSDKLAGVTCINVGFINNIPDSGFEAVERRFVELLRDAAGDVLVFFRHYTLPEIDRFAGSKERAKAIYATLDALLSTPLDALIVTGTEPREADLRDEPYWSSLTQVIDWAEQNTISTIFSCLSAHAAVQHRDGVERHRLARKCTGVFEETVCAQHPLTTDISPAAIPHSRWNDLSEGDLVGAGYTVLMKSADAGVGAFVKQSQSLSVFFQSHVEYDADTLFREYRRDIRRYLRGECGTYPDAPFNYLDEETKRLAELCRKRAVSATDRTTLVPECGIFNADPSLRNSWRSAAVAIYRNWLRYISAVKLERTALACHRARRSDVRHQDALALSLTNALQAS